MLPDYQDSPVFDEETALGLFEGDRELLDEVVELFRSTSRRLLTELTCALEGGDHDSLVRHAHSLKGAAANVGAERIRDLAYGLEKHSRQSLSGGEPVEYEEFFAALETELDAFDQVHEKA